MIKKIFFPVLFAIAATLVVASCNKVPDLPHYANGAAVALTASATTIAPAVADSNNTAVVFSWSNPKYATDSSTVKYVIEIDSSGRNFSKEYTKTVIGQRSASFLAKELNAVLLGFGFAYNTTYKVDVRITSSYGNNNEQYRSNVVTLSFTTYVVPPKVTPPPSGKLFLVGNATPGGWNNPVPLPIQQFKQVDSVTYTGTFTLVGGKQYLMLPVNGDWGNKYALADATVPGISAGGNFGYNGSNSTFNSNFPGPDSTGVYTILVDFQHGSFSVTKVKAWTSLWVPGDYEGWNPATAPTLNAIDGAGSYEGYINIPSGGANFKFNSLPSWSGTNYGAGAGSGTLSTSGPNINIASGGYYQILANTNNSTWSATATTWGLIGDFNGWSTDAPMTYNSSTNQWTGTITVGAAGGFKFRANGGWALNYGDNGATGYLEQGGANISITPGTHTITLDLHVSGGYYYTIK
jgi:hypothetical protein